MLKFKQKSIYFQITPTDNMFLINYITNINYPLSFANKAEDKGPMSEDL